MKFSRYGFRKIEELEALWPGFKTLWKTIKGACGTSRRLPRCVSFSDEPTRVDANDFDCARRFAVDLTENRVLSEVHVSCGEWATANTGQEKGITDVPPGVAVVTCTWNDFYGTFSMVVNVAPGTLKTPLPAATETT